MRPLILLTLAACAGGGDRPAKGPRPADTGAAPPADTGGPPDGDAGSPLRCRREAYPCTLAEADPAALARALALAEEVAGRMAGGQPGAAAAEPLRAEPDLIELWADAGGVSLRLAGAPPVLVSDPLATADLPAGPPAGPPLGPPPPDVVGAPGAPRRALVLDGMAAELTAFGFRTTGSLVQELLEGREEYAGGVELHAVSEAAPSLPLALLDGLDAYDVVAWEGHGKQLCRCPDALVPADACEDPGPEDCLTHLFLGFAEDYGPEVDDRVGVSLAVTPRGTRWITASSDLFFDTYPGGLDDALVLVDGCESMAGPDLAKALTGPGTATLGWTDSVYTSDVARLIDAFLGRLVDLGVDSAEALRQLEAEGALVGRATPVGGAPVFVAGPDSAPVRAREVITLHHPERGDPLREGDTVPLIGVPGDGAPDRLDLSVRVVGVAPGTAPEATVVVEAGGGARQSWKLDEGVEALPGEWALAGTLALGRDLAPGERLLLKATVALPEGGTSEQTVEVGTSGMVVTFDVQLEGAGDEGAFTARWTGEAELGWDPAAAAWAGSGPLDYPEASLTVADGLCTVEDLELRAGTLQVPRLLWTGVAAETVADLWVKGEDAAELGESFTLVCPGIGPGGSDLRLPQTGAFALAAFLGLHGEAWDAGAGVFTLTGFADPGEPGVLARWTVDRSAVVDGMTVREQSQLSLRAR